MHPVITWLQRAVLHPLSLLLFPVQAQGGFDGHHSFMVQYKAGEDLGLDMVSSTGPRRGASCGAAPSSQLSCM